MLMDTRQLAAFVAVVDKKSFSQAAERLGVTQPAISLQIRSLEDRLGRRLLDRSGRRVEPTEAGLVLYKRAQRMLQIEEQLEEELAQEETGELHGTLAIGASTGPGGRLVPLLLCEFQRGRQTRTCRLIPLPERRPGRGRRGKEVRWVSTSTTSHPTSFRRRRGRSRGCAPR